MIVGYARCSTNQQKDSIEGQIDVLKRHMNAEVIFSEISSGRNADRIELKKMLEYVRAGDVVVVQRLDRLARSVSDLIKIVNSLDARKIELRTHHETIDTSSASGKLIFHVFCCLAEFEANLIRERTVTGLENAKRMGRVGGRPKKLTGDDVIMLRTLKDSTSVSVRKLAKKYGVAVSTMYAYLKQ